MDRISDGPAGRTSDIRISARPDTGHPVGQISGEKLDTEFEFRSDNGYLNNYSPDTGYLDKCPAGY